MKKILFVIPEYSHGGTNKSLENLIHFIDKNKYEIHIYCLYEDGGTLYKRIFAPYVLSKSWLYILAHDNRVTRKIMGCLMKIFHDITFQWLYKYEANRLQNKYKFDTVIAFQEGVSTFFVAAIKQVKNKIAWIHCDYLNRVSSMNNDMSEYALYSSFRHIVSVSETAVNSFCKVFPTLSDRTTCIFNTIDADYILNKSIIFEDMEYSSSSFNILSVGRFVKIKQFHLIPKIVSELIKITKRNFCWYIIGDGEDKDIVAKTIESLKLDKYIKLLGSKDNPYPYFKNADLHVCLSKSESFSYTMAESKILHVPVLCNDIPVAKEVVSEDVGWISHINEMPQVLRAIIEDANGIYSNVQRSIATYSYDNERIIQKLYKIL